MRLHTWAMLLGCVGLLGGCAKDEPQKTEPASGSARGESCQARNDCASGLACIMGVCTQNEFPITVAPNECVRVECSTRDDCCADFVPTMPAATCTTYEQACNPPAPAVADPVACANYRQYCACNLDCQDQRCVRPQTCTTDTECYTFGLTVCSTLGVCVECETNEDCTTTGATCVANVCQAPCTRNEECDYFEACTAGQCVPTGCNDDRECWFRYDNLRMTCVDHECNEPCENDGQCSGNFEVCDGGRCVFVGCTTDEQCRVALDLVNETNSLAVARCLPPAPTP